MHDKLAPAALTFEQAGHFLDAAYMHPLSKDAGHAVEAYVRARQENADQAVALVSTARSSAIASFSRMHKCTPEALAFVPSTMAGENIVVNGLGIRPGHGRVVTDLGHFGGSLFMYHALRERGADISLALPRSGETMLEAYERAVRPGTTLVSVSAVSATTGAVHDLKALCDLAHQRGALVYADIVQAAGAMPLDLRESGVDFAACATYKWLMGDFGAGFFYARPESLGRLQRSQIGYRQLAEFGLRPVQSENEKDEWPISASSKDDVGGRVEVGTQAHAAIVALGTSLPGLEKIGLDAIVNQRRVLLNRIAAELPSLGFDALTNWHEQKTIAAYACVPEKIEHVRDALKRHNVRISVYAERIRISPSVFNTSADIDALIAALREGVK
ncbi:aminotransferase class V-fold PLP-dependent enzyme [Burkholderia pyrrocinia]|uniref:aminotransferase class V-fold PLP-dependent enzyme n=1 Tax=Burkholderia pyrrocinia TaxID=60550 RepID=UPI002AAFDD2A|nr:aminotransferase class V-fold PLP-dependent enzyme [Burkholderia pyrrocinia]